MPGPGSTKHSLNIYTEDEGPGWVLVHLSEEARQVLADAVVIAYETEPPSSPAVEEVWQYFHRREGPGV